MQRQKHQLSSSLSDHERPPSSEAELKQTSTIILPIRRRQAHSDHSPTRDYLPRTKPGEKSLSPIAAPDIVWRRNKKGSVSMDGLEDMSRSLYPRHYNHRKPGGRSASPGRKNFNDRSLSPGRRIPSPGKQQRRRGNAGCEEEENNKLRNTKQLKFQTKRSSCGSTELQMSEPEIAWERNTGVHVSRSKSLDRLGEPSSTTTTAIRRTRKHHHHHNWTHSSNVHERSTSLDRLVDTRENNNSNSIPTGKSIVRRGRQRLREVESDYEKAMKELHNLSQQDFEASFMRS